MERTFRMLTGFCHVFDDKIIFAPQQNLGKYQDENNLRQLQYRLIRIRSVMYPVIIFLMLGSFYFTVVDMIAGEVISGLLFLGLAIVLLRLVMLYILSNPTLIIRRDKIISIKFRKEVTWLGIWPMFILKFEKDNGKIGRKIIAMKYSLSEPGKELLDDATKILMDEGLLKD